MLIPWLIFFAFITIMEIYSYQAFKTLTKERRTLKIYQAISLIIILILTFNFLKFNRSIGQTKQTLFTMGLLLLVYIPKLFVSVFMMLEDVFRIITGTLKHFTRKSNHDHYLPDRRKRKPDQ